MERDAEKQGAEEMSSLDHRLLRLLENAAVLDSRTPSSQKCEAVQKGLVFKAHRLCITQLKARKS
jgi:hypothetical protein